MLIVEEGKVVTIFRDTHKAVGGEKEMLWSFL